ncbi:MAG: hypothetical protein L6262_03700 [Weeksellaceae bacterium]|nr:hypothetical protein [Weeksellaceae bacterium]
MKKYQLFFTVILFLCSFKGFSQNKTTAEKADELTKNMKSQIKFVNEKQDAVYAINLDFVTKLEQLKSQEGSKLTKIQNLKKLDSERDIQLKKVLSADEFKLFTDNKSKNRKTFKEHFKDSKN